MGRKGLGKGLDSLIPNIYDENFDSNSTQSLEDMLGDEDESVEEVIDNIESSQEKDESVEEQKQETPQEETQTESESSQTQEDDLESEESQEISSVQQEHIDEVKKIVEKNPRITLWSSRSSAVFRYLRKTEPEFSISKEASVLIEEAVSKKYPEIWALFEDE